MYLIGFQKNLPWGACDKEWNTVECYSKDLEKSCVENHPEFNNLTTWTWNKCVSYDDYCTLHGYSGYQQIQNDTEVYGSIHLPYLHHYFNPQVCPSLRVTSNICHTSSFYGVHSSTGSQTCPSEHQHKRNNSWEFNNPLGGNP